MTSLFVLDQLINVLFFNSGWFRLNIQKNYCISQAMRGVKCYLNMLLKLGKNDFEFSAVFLNTLDRPEILRRFILLYLFILDVNHSNGHHLPGCQKIEQKSFSRGNSIMTKHLFSLDQKKTMLQNIFQLQNSCQLSNQLLLYSKSHFGMYTLYISSCPCNSHYRVFAVQ